MTIELRDAWLSKVGAKTEDGEQIIDVPLEVFKALDLQEGEELLWTLLPGNMGFTVTKVEQDGTL